MLQAQGALLLGNSSVLLILAPPVRWVLGSGHNARPCHTVTSLVLASLLGVLEQ
jgi:hypothetical protein